MVKLRVLESLPHRRIRVCTVLVAFLLVATACGGEDTSDTTATTAVRAETTTTTSVATTTSAPPATDEDDHEDDHDHEHEEEHEEDDHEHEEEHEEDDHEHEEEHEEDDHEHEDEPLTLTVTDGSGREITLDSPAERVLCVQDNCTDLTSDLGIVPVAQHRGDGWGSAAAYYGDGLLRFRCSVIGCPWRRSPSSNPT